MHKGLREWNSHYIEEKKNIIPFLCIILSAAMMSPACPGPAISFIYIIPLSLLPKLVLLCAFNLINVNKKELTCRKSFITPSCTKLVPFSIIN